MDGRELPKYVSHKEVRALKIEKIIFDSELALQEGRETDGTAIIIPEDKRYEMFKVSAKYVSKHQPQKGGWYVVYEDGYESWSPDLAFRNGYSMKER